MVRAVADVGSNSVLLLVSQFNGGRWEPLLERSAVTGLGVGTKSSGLLGAVGMDATLQTLTTYRELALKAGAKTLRSGATMAVRIATNGDDFCRRGAAQGTPIEVLTGEQEAELGMQAVITDPLFSKASRISVIDPGGHSTELVTSDRANSRWATRFRRSYPIGAVGLREATIPTERATPGQILRAVATIDNTVGLCYRPNECGLVVSLGATGTNLITIRERMLEWDASLVHGKQLEYEEVSRASQWLLEMDDSERAAIAGIEPGRERSLHLGALILERFLFALRAETCVVSTRGWRHAYLELDE